MRYPLLLLVPMIPMAAEAQTRVEVRWGGTVGSYSSSRAGLDIVPKMSVDALVRRSLTRSLAVYGAFSRLEFGCEDQFCDGAEPTISGTHGIVGAETGWRALWARGGAMFGTARIGAADAEAGFGIQGAAGARFPIYGVEVLPGLSLERMQAGTSTEDDWATAISVDLGIAYRFRF